MTRQDYIDRYIDKVEYPPAAKADSAAAAKIDWSKATLMGVPATQLVPASLESSARVRLRKLVYIGSRAAPLLQLGWHADSAAARAKLEEWRQQNLAAWEAEMALAWAETGEMVQKFSAEVLAEMPAVTQPTKEKEDSMTEMTYGGRPAARPEHIWFGDDGRPRLTVPTGDDDEETDVLMEQRRRADGSRMPWFCAASAEDDNLVEKFIDALPAKPATEKKKEKRKMTTSKRSKAARAKAAAKTTGQQMGRAVVGAVQAAAAVELTDRLITLMIEKLGPQAPGFAELVATPVGRAMAQIALPAILKTGTETYREGLADEGEDVSRILDWVHRAATVAVEANTAAVTTTALKFAIGAAGDLLPLVMAAAGEPPPIPKGLNAGSESPAIDVSDLRVGARPKVHTAR